MHKRKLTWCPPELLRKLRTAIRKLGSNWLLRFESDKGFAREMRKLGFRAYDHSGAGSCTHFRSKKHGLILKIAGWCGRRIIPVYAVPTLVLRRSEDWERLVLQPLADTNKNQNAYDYVILERRFHEIPYSRRRLLFGEDLHTGNTAYYLGRPAVIDW